MAMNIDLDKKEEEVRIRFYTTREKAAALEGEIQKLQVAHEAEMKNLTRLQGAMNLITELKKERDVQEKEPK